MDTRNKLLIAGTWLLEEAVETTISASKNDDAMALDGLFDALGIVIAALTAVPTEQRAAAYAEYIDAQVRRGRPIDMPHQAAIAVPVRHLDTMVGADGPSNEMLADRAKRAPTRTETAFTVAAGGAVLIDSAKRRDK